MSATIELRDSRVVLDTRLASGNEDDIVIMLGMMLCGYNRRFCAVGELLNKAFHEVDSEEVEAFLEALTQVDDDAQSF